ncbi:hypothetical protein I4U23_025865 [Adineta vaga]|nr:hypothetical protein I4U23_025865 [Adineta vaga]
MTIGKVSLAEKKKKTIFSRFTNRFINQSRYSKRDQSVQTSRHPSSSNHHSNTETLSHERRSSLKTFLNLQSPKPISLLHRTRRRSINLKTPKRLSSECLQVALIRKIQSVNQFESKLVFPSTTSCYSYKQISNDETTNRDEYISIGPMKWSTPNRTTVYKTSSPNMNYHSDQQRRLYTVDQLSFSNIFDLVHIFQIHYDMTMKKKIEFECHRLAPSC